MKSLMDSLSTEDSEESEPEHQADDASRSNTHEHTHHWNICVYDIYVTCVLFSDSRQSLRLRV